MFGKAKAIKLHMVLDRYSQVLCTLPAKKQQEIDEDSIVVNDTELGEGIASLESELIQWTNFFNLEEDFGEAKSFAYERINDIEDILKGRGYQLVPRQRSLSNPKWRPYSDIIKQ